MEFEIRMRGGIQSRHRMHKKPPPLDRRLEGLLVFEHLFEFLLARGAFWRRCFQPVRNSRFTP